MRRDAAGPGVRGVREVCVHACVRACVRAFGEGQWGLWGLRGPRKVEERRHAREERGRRAAAPRVHPTRTHTHILALLKNSIEAGNLLRGNDALHAMLGARTRVRMQSALVTMMFDPAPPQ